MAIIVQSDIESLEKEKEINDKFLAIFVDPNCSSCKISYDVFNQSIFNDLRILEISIPSEIKKCVLYGFHDFMEKYSINITPGYLDGGRIGWIDSGGGFLFL